MDGIVVFVSERLIKQEVLTMKMFFFIPFIVCFFLVASACQKAQEQNQVKTQEEVGKQEKKVQKLTDEDEKKLKSLGYVE